MEGARGPCGLEKEWTGLSWNEMWREPEDHVAWRKRVSREMWREPEDRVTWRKRVSRVALTD